MIDNLFEVDNSPFSSVDLYIVLFSGSQLELKLTPSFWCVAVDYLLYSEAT